MNTNRPNLDEAMLLQLVEGELSPEVEAGVWESLRTDPVLFQQIARMRADRAAVAELGAVTAPASLMVRVESLLEREALVGIEPAELPRLRRSATDHVEDGWWGAVFARIGAPRLALAAALTLAAGVTLWLGIAVFKQLPSIKPSEDVAALDQHTGDDSQPISSESPTATQLVVSGTAGSADKPLAMASKQDVAVAPTTEQSQGVVSASNVSPARAVTLASQGRLAVVVRARDAETTLSRIENLAARTGGAIRWRHLAGSDGSIPPAYAALVETREIAKAARQPVWLADDGLHVNRQSASPHLNPVLKGLYLVRVSEQESELRSLLAALTSGPAQVAEFVELASPVEHGVPLDSDSVLWWTQGPAAWTGRASVPVIVEVERVE